MSCSVICMKTSAVRRPLYAVYIQPVSQDDDIQLCRCSDRPCTEIMHQVSRRCLHADGAPAGRRLLGWTSPAVDGRPPVRLSGHVRVVKSALRLPNRIKRMWWTCRVPRDPTRIPCDIRSMETMQSSHCIPSPLLSLLLNKAKKNSSLFSCWRANRSIVSLMHSALGYTSQEIKSRRCISKKDYPRIKWRQVWSWRR